MGSPADLPPQVVQVPAPVQWGLGVGQLPDGTKMCLLQVTQGQLSVNLQLLAHDMRKLAADIAGTAAQAESALIIPAGVNVNGNVNGNG